MSTLRGVLILAAVLGVSSTLTYAGAGSYGPSSPASGFIPIEDAQRVLHFQTNRMTFFSDGTLLVCPFESDVEVETLHHEPKFCRRNKNDAWVKLLDLRIPGYEISGIQYFFSGNHGDKELLVYWRKAK